MQNAKKLGKYRNERRAKQLIRFDEMVFEGNKSFTDIDAVMDYRGVAWLMFEVKTRGAELTKGQRILAENFVDMAGRGGRYAVVAVVEHGVMDCSEDVRLSDCEVRSLYDTIGMRWRPPREPMTAETMAERFVRYARGLAG